VFALFIGKFHSIIHTKIRCPNKNTMYTNTIHIFPDRSYTNWFQIFSIIHLYLKSCQPQGVPYLAANFIRLYTQKQGVQTKKQYTQIQFIYFQIEAPPTDFNYFLLSTCISNFASHSVCLIYRQISFDYTHKNSGSFSTNRSTVAHNTIVMALEQLGNFQITTDLSFPKDRIFVFS
jgi:hypothetical protein